MYNTCRLCLRKRAKKNIFEHDSTIHDKLLSYCKLNISKNDGLPEDICNKCIKKLECVVQFINKCEESDRLLRQNPHSVVECDKVIVKDEPDSDLDDRSFKSEDTSDEDYIPSFARDVIDSSKMTIKNEDVKENINITESTKVSCIDDDKIPLGKLIKRNKTSTKQTKSKKLKSEENISAAELIDISKIEIKPEIIDFDDLPDTFPDETCFENETDKKKKGKLKNNKEKTRKNRSSKFGDESQLCFTCGKCFPKASYLRQHILKHSGENHKCSQCPKSFATRELMKVHERRHVQEKNFPCQVCGHTFTSGYLAKKHYKMVHEKNYAVPCNLCHKVLSNRRSLMEHMKIHTGEKNFECKICLKKFAHKLSLVCHTRVHTGEQPYSCRYCEKRFTILKSLKEHERLHTGEKPYGCPLCPKRFEQLGNMKSHFRYNHKGLNLKEAQEAKAKAQALTT